MYCSFISSHFAEVRIIFNFLLQVLVGLPIMIYGLPESSYDWRALPSTDILARDVIIWLLVEEVCFFYVHKWLHDNKKMYAAVHKIHHTWTAPISLVAIYCHPFEHLASNLTPVLLGPILCGSHAAALAIFLAVGTIHTLIVHSGYWFCDDNGMHDEHHAKFNVNFGVMGLMDSFYGTYQLPPGARVHTKWATLHTAVWLALHGCQNSAKKVLPAQLYYVPLGKDKCVAIQTRAPPNYKLPMQCFILVLWHSHQILPLG